jgi:4-amino-4-deoxy-L-arabinose transferase-like glycosyltransferase
VRGLVDRARTAYLAIPRRERLAVIGAMALSFVIVLVFVIANRHAALRGDEIEYDIQGRFFVAGKWWWSTTPFGVAHASAWKVPIYPAWVGFWYDVLGSNASRVEAVQALLAPLTVALSWALARRLFTPVVAIWTAYVVAIFPLGWQYIGLLYPEALAIPITLVILLLILGREPTVRRAIAAGAVIGIGMLVRPNMFILLAVAATAWIVATGWRRGLGLAALATGLAVLVVLPWTIRNTLTDSIGFIPLSVQDGAVYGTFNAEAASDPRFPYAWRAQPHPLPSVFTGPPVSDSEVRSKTLAAGRDYIKDHPTSVISAFYWNGIRRFWDLQKPSLVTFQVPFQGGTKTVTLAGIWMYYVLLPLAAFGLWLVRRRRDVILPMAMLALTSSIVFTVDASTRYRAPLEPLIAMFAVAGAAALVAKVQTRRSGDAAEVTPTR